MSKSRIGFYQRQFKNKEKKFNQHLPLPPYFESMIGKKKEVLIAELGAGPVNTIGNYLPGVEVKIVASDVKWPEYQKYWKTVPIVPIEYQDMEGLTYPDETFDIVHCVNALDHTKNSYKAVEEMKRVCKKGGWVYLRHAPDQKKIYGGHHYHNIQELEFEGFETKFEWYLKENVYISTWNKKI